MKEGGGDSNVPECNFALRPTFMTGGRNRTSGQVLASWQSVPKHTNDLKHKVKT